MTKYKINFIRLISIDSKIASVLGNYRFYTYNFEYRGFSMHGSNNFPIPFWSEMKLEFYIRDSSSLNKLAFRRAILQKIEEAEDKLNKQFLEMNVITKDIQNHVIHKQFDWIEYIENQSEWYAIELNMVHAVSRKVFMPELDINWTVAFHLDEI